MTLEHLHGVSASEELKVMLIFERQMAVKGSRSMPESEPAESTSVPITLLIVTRSIVGNASGS